MLVWCPKCGTSYDVEKRGSICPRCGYDRNEYGKQKIKRKREQRKAFWKFTKFQIISCSILLILIVGVAVINIVSVNQLITENEENKQVGIVAQAAHTMNDRLYINSGYVNITGCFVVDTWSDIVPEGYSMIFVTYETSNKQESRVANEVSVYLQFSTGEYFSPLDYQLLEDVTEQTENELRGVQRISEDFSLSKGNLAFLVPNDVTDATLTIYSMEKKGAVSTLDSVYQIPVEWEVQ